MIPMMEAFLTPVEKIAKGAKQPLVVDVIKILRSLFVLALIIPQAQGTPVTASVLWAVAQFGLYMFSELTISRFSRGAVAGGGSPVAGI